MPQPRKRRLTATLVSAVVGTLMALSGALIAPTAASATPSTSFDWNWEYAAPTCTALTVTYPDNIPSGQANDANIRIVNLDSGGGEVTLNFHNNTGTWSGNHSFTYADHPQWPGWDHFKVVWTQVGGTNYHWQGEVSCGGETPPPPTDHDWQYAAPTCTALNVTYPSGVAYDDATDAYIRIVNLNKENEEVTLHYHSSEGHWYGDMSFVYADHPQWPDWTYYKVVWTKVGGTTYEWTGEVTCGTPAPPEPPTKPALKHGEDVVESEPVCLAEGTGTVTRTATPWTQDWTLNEDSNTWVEGEKVYGEPVVTTREATAEECPEVVRPKKPEPLAGEEIFRFEPDCRAEGGGTVTHSVQYWTQDYVWSDELDNWTEGEKVYSDMIYMVTRDATEGECPATVVPPVNPPKDNPPKDTPKQPDTKQPDKTLAVTGGDISPLAISLGLTGLVLGSGLLVGSAALRRRKASR